MPTLAAFYRNSYEPIRLLGRSETTKADMRSAFLLWEFWSGGSPLESITLADACRFLAWACETRSAATCNKLRSYLRAVLHFAQRQHLLNCDWLDDIPRMPSPRRVPRAFLLSELEAMLDACRGLTGAVTQEIPAGLFWEALLLTFYDTGLRVSACLAIQQADADLDNRWLLVHGETQKQRADQLLGLSAQTAEALSRIWQPPREFLFPWPLSKVALRRRLLSILRQAGVAHGKAAGGRGLWQRFRRLTASELQAHGANPTAVLGHSSPLVTRAYLDPRICGSTRAVDCLPRPSPPQSRLRVI